jgi:hypothetical protein
LKLYPIAYIISCYIQLKYHHTNTFIELNQAYSEWSSLQVNIDRYHHLPSFDKLYQNTEVAKQFVNDYSTFRVKLAQEGVKGNLRSHSSWGFVTMMQWEDYIGQNGDFYKQYQFAQEDIFYKLTTLDPNVLIEFSYESDEICRSCQRKSSGTEVGEHCIKDYRGYYDYVWDYVLDCMRGRPVFVRSKHSDNARRDLRQEGPVFTAPIGLFRDSDFLYSLGEEVEFYSQEVFREMNILKIIGILEKVEGKRLPVVSERYLRGECE